MDNRKILRTVRAVGGQSFKPGQEDELAAAVSQRDLDALVANQTLLGDWRSTFTGVSGEDGSKFLSLEETMKRFGEGDSSDIVFASLKHHQATIANERNRGYSPDEKAMKKTGNEGTGKSLPNDGDKELPEDFPMRAAFVELGFKTLEEIQKLSKEQLVGLKGIGEATAEKALAYGK